MESIEKQLELFRKGSHFLNLVRPAVIGDGIVRLTADEVEGFISEFDSKKDKLKIIKFVPASGAATRMFEKLISVLNNKNISNYGKLKIEAGLDNAAAQSAIEFFDNLQLFPFYRDLREVLKCGGFELEKLMSEGDINIILEYLLTDKGINYASKPKGVLKFHSYADGESTPVEEHIKESAEYISDKNISAHLHFTISEEHRALFEDVVSAALKKYNDQYRKFEISFSYQKRSTDTIAVNMNNEPIKNGEGKYLFRPGGHGALLENMNDLDADIIFIKNIDNVAQERYSSATIKFKKALGGYLVHLKNKINEYLHLYESDKFIDDEFSEWEKFANKKLQIVFPGEYQNFSLPEKKKYIYNKFNRPVRVCGMVVNEGQPGGGPFWIKSGNNDFSLQVVEKSQVNPGDLEQRKIIENSTHFSPVDFVCAVKDHKGQKFDLLKFRDDNAYFISEKTSNGDKIKALELPGLWNGGMADWITVFVEVPKETFNPVKEINDLLKPEHLPADSND